MNQNSEMIELSIQRLSSYCNKNLNIPLWPNGPTGLDYISGLVRCSKFDENNRGSYVKKIDTLHKTIIFLNDMDWEEVFPEKELVREGCRYFKTFIPENFKAVVNITTVGECDLKKIRIKSGLHGQELTIKTNKSLEMCNYAHLIMECEMMSTWYPGPITTPTPETFPEDRNLWNKNWAVKLVE